MPLSEPLSDHDWRSALPKVSLFSHLEATPSPAQWWALLQAFGGDPRVKTEADVAAFFATEQDAVELFWAWKSHTLSTRERWTQLAASAARALVSHNVVYAELAVSPLDVEHHGWSLAELLTAITTGFREVPEIDANVLIDVHVERGPAATLDLVEQASTLLADGLVGLHIGVDDHELDDAWAPVCERCESLAMPRSVRVHGARALSAAVDHLAPSRVLASGDWASGRALIEQLIRERVCLLLAPALGAAHHDFDADWFAAAERDGMRVALVNPLPAFSAVDGSAALCLPFASATRAQTRAWQQAAAGATTQPYQARRQLLGDLVTDPVWFEELASA